MEGRGYADDNDGDEYVDSVDEDENNDDIGHDDDVYLSERMSIKTALNSKQNMTSMILQKNERRNKNGK